MSHKTRKLSINSKIVIFSVIIIVMIVALLGYNSAVRMEEEMLAMGIEQAAVAAKVGVNSLDADAVASIQFGDTTSEAYTQLFESMSEVSDICGVVFMYTLVVEDGQVYYQASTDGEAYELFDYSYEDLKDVFDGHEFVQDFIDITEDGALVTAYIPIIDSTGKVVAALGSDFDASNIISSRNKSRQRTFQIGFIGVVFASVLMIILAKRITKGIWKVNDKLYELVNNEGDLTQTMDISSGDEMEILAENVNALLKYIKKIMLNISTNSVELSESTTVVTNNIASAGNDILDISATMEEMSAGMQETTASLNQINSALNTAFDVLKEITKDAGQGRATTEDIQVKATKIHADAEKDRESAFKKTEEMIKVLSDAIEASKAVAEINSLTDNIISITSQTNLLSLNASIEAARAGEAGRGFAVVADEIGKLATDSAEAATEIRKVSEKVIAAVNQLSDEASAVIEFLKKVVEEGYGSLIEVSSDYNKNASDINEIMVSFSSAASDFEETMDGIRETLDAINIAVEENAKGIVNVAEVSTNLSESMEDINGKADVNMNIVDKLADEVGKFKLE